MGIMMCVVSDLRVSDSELYRFQSPQLSEARSVSGQEGAASASAAGRLPLSLLSAGSFFKQPISCRSSLSGSNKRFTFKGSQAAHQVIAELHFHLVTEGARLVPWVSMGGPLGSPD